MLLTLQSARSHPRCRSALSLVFPGLLHVGKGSSDSIVLLLRVFAPSEFWVLLHGLFASMLETCDRDASYGVKMAIHIPMSRMWNGSRANSSARNIIGSFQCSYPAGMIILKVSRLGLESATDSDIFSGILTSSPTSDSSYTWRSCSLYCLEILIHVEIKHKVT